MPDFLRSALPLLLATSLSGCNSMLATLSGPEPVGKPAGTRTLSMRLEDSGIERTAGINILKADPQFRDANVNVISFYGSVLMAGQVQNEALRQRAEQVVRDIAEVRQVHNELTIGEASYYLERISDGTITKQVQNAFLLEKGFPSSRTRVFTVAGTVYLMGKLTAEEADLAVAIISKVGGVKKIVKMLDYLPAPATATAS